MRPLALTLAILLILTLSLSLPAAAREVPPEFEMPVDPELAGAVLHPGGLEEPQDVVLVLRDPVTNKTWEHTERLAGACFVASTGAASVSLEAAQALLEAPATFERTGGRCFAVLHAQAGDVRVPVSSAGLKALERGEPYPHVRLALDAVLKLRGWQEKRLPGKIVLSAKT